MSAAEDAIDGMDWQGMADDVEAYMRQMYPQLMALGYDEANGDGLPVEVTFDVTDPNISKTIDRLATRIRGVTDEVKASIAQVVTDALSGQVIPSNAEIASRIRDQAPDFSAWKSMQVARTETGTALNLAHTHAYMDAGLTHVDVMDGDDDEECSAANGSRWTIEEAQANPLGHPNCVRAFAPVVS